MSDAATQTPAQHARHHRIQSTRRIRMDSITHPSRRTLLKSVAATSVAAAFGGLLPLRSAWAQDLPLVSYPPSYQLKTPRIDAAAV